MIYERQLMSLPSRFSSLPTTMIFATGGTIAGRGSSSTASGVYSAGAIGVEALVEGE